MNNAVIGANGFIGSNLVAELRNRGEQVVAVTRGTVLAELADQAFDRIFFCAGNSKGFVSERQPLTCLQENVGDLHGCLTRLRTRRFVHVSSVSVYPQDGRQRSEDTPIDIAALPLYGAHKYLAEQYVRRFAADPLIVRATGFFGPGLRKNLIFDVKSGRPDIYLTRDSVIDYMPVSWFCRTIVDLADRSPSQVINVGSGIPLGLGEIIGMKPGAWRFHEEKRQDDRNIAFERLYALVADRLDRGALLRAIREFVGEGRHEG